MRLLFGEPSVQSLPPIKEHARPPSHRIQELHSRCLLTLVGGPPKREPPKMGTWEVFKTKHTISQAAIAGEQHDVDRCGDSSGCVAHFSLTEKRKDVYTMLKTK